MQHDAKLVKLWLQPVALAGSAGFSAHAQRADYELLGEGDGIQWPVLDEDVSVAGLLRGLASADTQR